LITLGIIGIVAVLTIPSLIANHQKKQVEVKLKKFYSVMSQALLRYEADEGITPESFYIDEEYVKTADGFKKWYNKTLDKYLQSVSQEKEEDRNFKVIFNDGSGFSGYIFNTNSINIFYCTEAKYCRNENMDGRTGFLFEINKGRFYTSLYSFRKQTRTQLLEKCKYGNYDNPNTSSLNRRHTCARLIEIDGWQIKDDYPWKQTILKPKE